MPVGKTPAVAHFECVECYDKSLEQSSRDNKDKYHPAKDANICVGCRINPAASDSLRCAECIPKRKASANRHALKRRNERRDAGTCQRCSNSVDTRSVLYCETHRILESIRATVIKSLARKKVQKEALTEDLFGCDYLAFIIQFQMLFESGMTWQNRGYGPGKWHIDHIRPLASFDLTKLDEVRQAWNHTNLRPLWHDENLTKSSWYKGELHRGGR